jgi:hypothetical protein
VKNAVRRTAVPQQVPQVAGVNVATKPVLNAPRCGFGRGPKTMPNAGNNVATASEPLRQVSSYEALSPSDPDSVSHGYGLLHTNE